MNAKYHRFGLWCGILFIGLFGSSLMNLMGFIPPPSPTLTGPELVARYQEHLYGIRFSIIVGYAAATFSAPWSVLLFIYMARIEGGRYPMLSMASLSCGILNAVAFCLPYICWGTAIYRMERDPETIRMLNDTAWLLFVMLYPPFVIQIASIGWVGLTDKSPTPTFPRWFCFLSFWAAILILPGALAVFFLTGPFAWNGLLSFWIPVGAFAISVTDFAHNHGRSQFRRHKRTLSSVSHHHQ